MSNEEWKFRMVRGIAGYLNKRNVCCGLTFIVLHTIAWPNLVVWILIDAGLVILLILSRILQFTKKTSTRVDIMNPGRVKNGQRGFGSAMNETLSGCESSSIRSSSRRTKYSHEYSRCTPNEHRTITPLPTISAIRNRLSYRYNGVYSNILTHHIVIYSAAEASIRSTTPNPFSPRSTKTLQERTHASHKSPRPAHQCNHMHVAHNTRSSVLHIAKTNLPVTREACSPVMVKVAPLGTSPRM